MKLIPDDPFSFIEQISDGIEFLANNVPWWVIILAGLMIAIFVPLIV